MPERVADQDVEDLPYRRRRCQARGQLRFGHRGQPPSPRGQWSLPPGADLMHQARQVGRGGRTFWRPDQADQVVNGDAEMLTAAQRVLDRRPEVRVGAVQRAFEPDHQRGKRRPELM